MMRLANVRFFKGQFKIQQMVFVLVAIVLFFALVSVFYISIRFSSLREDVSELRKDEVIESVRKISGTPEFVWTNWEDCSSCIDLDKAFIVKRRNSYQGFWEGLSLLQVSRVYPLYSAEECNLNNYPDCNQITLISSDDYDAFEAFVSLCRHDSSIGQKRCELGKVVMGFEDAR